MPRVSFTKHQRREASIGGFLRIISDEEIARNLKKLRRRKGQLISRAEARCILVQYYCQLRKLNSHNSAVRETACNLMVSWWTVSKVVKSWKKHDEIRIQGRGHSARGGLTDDVRFHLVRLVDEMNKTGAVTAKKLQARLRAPPTESDDPDHPDKDRKPMETSITTVQRWLKLLGYRYAKGKKGFVVTDRRKSRIREYLIDFSKALQKEKAKTHTIVYTDESYINVNHKEERSWFTKDNQTSEHSSGKGKRLIIVHAITIHGPLVLWEGKEWQKDPIKEGWFQQLYSQEGGTQSAGAAAAAAGAVAAAEAWKAAGGDPVTRIRSKAVRQAVKEATNQAAAAAASLAGGNSGGSGGGGGSGDGAVRTSNRSRKPSEKVRAAAAAAPATAARAGGRRSDGGSGAAGGGAGCSRSRSRETGGKGKGKAAPTRVGGAPAGSTGGETGNAGSRWARCKVEDEKTAEFVYPAGEKSADDDYHKNMDADTFLLWVQHRLVPAFRERFGPDQKMILVMDNAAYHHGMPDGWTSPLQASKKVNLATLRKLPKDKLDRIKTKSLGTKWLFKYGINVSRNGETKGFVLPADEESFAHFPVGPSKEELQHATYRILDKRAPEMLMTRAALYFKDQGIGELLFTPPYCPDLQPIELFWAYGKNYVADNFIAGRGLADVHAMLLEGLYGMGEVVTNERVGNMVKHSLKIVDEYIQRDEVLTGDRGNLQNVPDDYRVSKGASVMSKLTDLGVNDVSDDGNGSEDVSDDDSGEESDTEVRDEGDSDEEESDTEDRHEDESEEEESDDEESDEDDSDADERDGGEDGGDESDRFESGRGAGAKRAASPNHNGNDNRSGTRQRTKNRRVYGQEFTT